MRSHDVNDVVPAKLGEIVRSDDRIFESDREDIIRPSLKLHKVIEAKSVFQGPLHVGDQTSQREPLPSSSLKDLLHQSQRLVLIEVASAQICVSPSAQLELAALLCRGHIDAGRLEPA
jgi:hypothetical protein